MPDQRGLLSLQRDDARWLLSPEEAVDLARYRGWLGPGGAVYVPDPREAWVAELSWGEAEAFLREVDAPLGLDDPHADPALPVLFVVLRGPVSDRVGPGGQVVGEGLGFVEDLRGRARYVGVGAPWSLALPPGARSIPIPIGPTWNDVSLARAEAELGGAGLASLTQTPWPLRRTRVAINLAGEPVDATGATFSQISVTFAYADQQNVERMWLTQSTFTGTLSAPGELRLRELPLPVGSLPVREFRGDGPNGPFGAFAFQAGEHAFFLSLARDTDLADSDLTRAAGSISTPYPDRRSGVPGTARIVAPADPRDPWQALQRPVRLPTVEIGEACPTAGQPIRSTPFGIAQGQGPVYPVALSYEGIPPTGSSGFSSLHLADAPLPTLMWLAEPEFAGTVLVRGSQLGDEDTAGADIRFVPGDRELRLAAAPYGSIVPGESAGLRHLFAYTVIPMPGCYGFQIDGLDFTRVVIVDLPRD
jgi:hypothetical protein